MHEALYRTTLEELLPSLSGGLREKVIGVLTMPEDPLKTLLRQMFNGWILYENSWDKDTEKYTRGDTECFIEAAGGNENRGYLLYLFSYWGNDIQSAAPHYGIALDRDKEGKLCIREDIEPAPGKDYYWSEGEWKKFEEDEKVESSL